MTTLECLFLTDPCLKRVPSLTSVGLDWGWNGKKMSAWMDSHFGPWVILLNRISSAIWNEKISFIRILPFSPCWTEEGDIQTTFTK